MSRRSIIVLVLIGYSALLINLVVFKGAIRLMDWARPGREERVEDGRPGRGRGRGDSPGARGSESRPGERTRTAPATLAVPRLSTSRFALLHANYIPFKTILSQLRGEPRWSSAIINLVGNILLFVPLGLLVLLVYPRMRWHKTLVIAIAVGVTMEVMEGVFRVGVVDVDDVILNALGVMIGCWMCRALARRKEAAVIQPA